jgi:hypothetical protein
MGQTRKVVLIIAVTAIMAILTSIFAYFFDYLTTYTPRSVTKFVVAIKVIESRILMYGLFNYFYYD